MKILVLGSGDGPGIPAWNDGSERALRARAGDAQVPRRRSACLAVSADGTRYSILEAPFHLAERLIEHPCFAPRAGTRSVPLDSILFTAADLDGCAGALALARGLSVRIASPHGVREALVDHDTGFRTLAACWTGQAFDRPFPLDREGRLEARFFPLASPAAEDVRDSPGGAGARWLRAGVRVTDLITRGRLVWAPRIARYDSATLAELRAADLRFVDGTFFSDDEVRMGHPGFVSARELGHLAVGGRTGSLVWLSGMSGRSVYVHLSASNPACDGRDKAWTRIQEAGVQVAWDGMEAAL